MLEVVGAALRYGHESIRLNGHIDVVKLQVIGHQLKTTNTRVLVHELRH